MGEPWFRMKDIAEQHGISALPSNYTLYGDLSSRVMETLANFSPRQEIYSIDECFLGLEGFDPATLADYGQKIRKTVKRNLGIPISIGIADTKTLAKLANYCAKKGLSGSDGVCDFGRLDDVNRNKLFSSIPVGEVWGVGHRVTKSLVAKNINTVEEFRRASPEYLRQQFSIMLVKTVNELNGIPCIELEEVASPRQQIRVSHTFGAPVTALEELSKSVACYTTRAVEKLWRDRSVATSICVFISTNPHCKQDEQYSRSVAVPLAQPTDDTTRLVKAALYGLKSIYKPALRYAKGGVLLMGLHEKGAAQRTLFDGPGEQSCSDKLMYVMDSVNQIMGKDKVAIGTSDTKKRWTMNRVQKSRNYTTDFNDLMEAW
jgi:DNA polymerase V